MGIFNLFIVFAILHFRVFFSKSFKNLGISHFLVAESATIEMAFPDVCLEVRESGSPEVRKSEKKITLEARVRNR